MLETSCQTEQLGHAHMTVTEDANFIVCVKYIVFLCVWNFGLIGPVK